MQKVPPAVPTAIGLGLSFLGIAAGVSGYQSPILGLVIGIPGAWLFGSGAFGWIRDKPIPPSQQAETNQEHPREPIPVLKAAAATADPPLKRFGFGMRDEIRRGMVSSSDSLYQSIRDGMRRAADAGAMKELAEELRCTRQARDRERMEDLLRSRGRLSLPSPLKIEFGDSDYSYVSVGPREGKGIYEGQRKTYSIIVFNARRSAVQGVEVSLITITPMPSQFMGRLPIPLHFAHEDAHLHRIDFAGGQRRPVEVVSYFDKLWNPYLSIEHAVQGLAKGIDDGGEAGYTIEIAVTGQGAAPSPARKFKIGLAGQDLYMRSADKPGSS